MNAPSQRLSIRSRSVQCARGLRALAIATLALMLAVGPTLAQAQAISPPVTQPATPPPAVQPVAPAAAAQPATPAPPAAAEPAPAAPPSEAPPTDATAAPAEPPPPAEVSPAAAAPLAPAEPLPQATEENLAGAAPLAPPVEEAPPKLPAYILWGVGGASLIVGTIFGIASISSKDEFDSNPTYENADTVHAQTIAADIGLGLGIILGITGTIFYVAASSAKPAGEQADALGAMLKGRASVRPRPGGAGLTLRF